jgi:uncharacterized protein YnzC (UPF0291/DUF896 family)
LKKAELANVNTTLQKAKLKPLTADEIPTPH